jgi:hypothetical protein
LVLDVLCGELSVYGQQKEANNEKQQFWSLRSTFNSSLRKYFNSIFLSTVMTTDNTMAKRKKGQTTQWPKERDKRTINNDQQNITHKN